MIHVIDNVLPKIVCQDLIEIYEAYKHLGKGFDDNVVSLDLLTDDPRELAYEAADIALYHTKNLYQANIKIEYPALASLKVGGSLNNHSDNVKWDGNMYVPNHTPNRTHTAVIYLENGIGGETIFGDNEGTEAKYERVIAQKQGRMHIHPCGPAYYHRVTETFSPRHTLLVWFENK